jgi:hypothetical protein
MVTYEDFLWLWREGIVKVEAFYEPFREQIRLEYTWQTPEALSRVLQEHGPDIVRRVRERDTGMTMERILE